jgi:hypothetical protein
MIKILKPVRAEETCRSAEIAKPAPNMRLRLPLSMAPRNMADMKGLV